MSWSREQLEQQWVPMVRAARGVLGSKDEAEECAAQALVQVLERPTDEVVNLQAFLVTVAKRRALDRLRVLERARLRHEKLTGLTDHYVVDIAEDVVARAEARWMDAQARRLLQPKVYSLLQLVADGEPLNKVAASLGMTTRAASSHLRRARTMLRSTLAKTLAITLPGWAWLRRQSLWPANTTVAVGMFLLLAPYIDHGIGLRHPDPATSPTVQIRPLDSHSQRLLSRPGRMRRASASATTSAHRPPQPPLAQHPLLHLNEGLGAGTKVTMERHGTGPQGGPVQTVRECLDNFTISSERVGC